MHVPATATAATATGTQAPAALSAVRRAPWVANGARRSFGSDDASHEAVHSVAVFDAADAKGWGTPSNEPCFILLFEVLDNLPHDRVQWCREENEWQETRVRHLEGWEKSCNKVLEEEKSRPCEVLRRVSDPLIQRCLTTVLNQSPSSGVSPPLSSSSGSSSSSSGGGGSMLSRLSSSLQGMLASLMGGERVTWLPTGCMRLLETVYTARPNATVIAADFSFLPDVRIAGANAPLVAAKRGGVTQDQPTYLVPRGSADIFFPTDFGLLERMDAAACAPSSVERIRGSISSAEFLSSIAGNTFTKDGYNPLLHDFPNTRIFVSTPEQLS
ncbi:hypothetical protein CLOP_g19977 [Closterium sp. NIES-67]|nr:hypothetical protein CLOP_g19977 [Closterium sp. NIES-67]